jgi:nicotinate-nucleotide adenylyltransferase
VEKIGLFGGSFDPVHRGHLLVAKAALEELALDRLIFIPTAKSPFKQNAPLTSGATRMRMLRLALTGEIQCEVDDREIRRGGVSYTIETLRDLVRERPDTRFHWMIGADHLSLLPTWREPDSLARLAEFVVIPRPGADVSPLPPPWQVKTLRGWPLKISSSEIRERVRTQRDIRHLVSTAVLEVIEREQLYRSVSPN